MANSYVIHTYESLDPFLEQCDRSPFDNTCSSIKSEGYDWDRGLNYAAIRNAAVYGHEISTSGLEVARAKIKLAPIEIIDAELSIEGAVPDIATYLQGLPECMLSFTPAVRPVQVVTIRYSVSYPYYVEAETIYARGAAICAAVDAIEAQRVRASLYATEIVRSSYGRYMIVETCIKSADQPLDMGRVAATTHPAFLRRLLFAHEEAEPQPIRKEFGFYKNGSYGYVDDLPDDAPLSSPADYYVPTLRATTATEAIAQVFTAIPVERITADNR